ncbi:MAG: zinc-binding protein [Chloroflexota bacterium]
MTAYCQLCGGKIAGRGQFFRSPGWPAGITLRVCPACAAERPRCRECGIPLAGSAGLGEALCVSCSQAQRRCLACGSPVQGKFYEYDGLGPYCPACSESGVTCDSCFAPLSREHWQLSDGRRVCAHCHASAVYTQPEAGRLYEELRGRAAAHLGLALNIPTGLALVDREGIRQVIQRQAQRPAERRAAPGAFPAQPDPERTLGLYARRGMRRGIYVQAGLPRLLFLQVAAHEFAHAWQGENCPLLTDALVHEGFAEWVSYRVLETYDGGAAQARMLKRSDLYGDALRWALELEQRAGAPALIELCRRNGL